MRRCINRKRLLTSILQIYQRKGVAGADVRRCIKVKGIEWEGWGGGAVEGMNYECHGVC